MSRPANKKKKVAPGAPAKNPAPRPAAPSPRSVLYSPETLFRNVPRWVFAFALFAVVLAVFWPAINNDFINCDDDLYVTANPHVLQGFTWPAITWAFQSFEATNWHPLTWLSNILACDLFGLKPAGHHFINILLHAVNAALLFLVLELMTRARWKCLVVAALFALHPLRVESVAWVAERKDVLSSTFWLLTIWAHVRYVNESKVQSSNFKLYYVLALLFFVCGLMSKPMVVTLPFTLLLLDYWPLERMSNPRIPWLEKIPCFVLSAISCAITYQAQKSGGAVGTRVPIHIRIETALLGYARYLGKMFWPTHLAMQYPYPHHWPMAGVILSAAGLLAVSALAIIYRNKLPWLPAGWFWYVGTLVPVIGLVQVGLQSMADRYTYIPEIGIALILVWGSLELWQRCRLPVKFLAGLAFVTLFVCACLTRQQIGYWQNSRTLFTHAVEVTDGNYSAWEHLGDYEFKHGQPQAAADAFAKTLEIDPKNEEAQTGIAYILFFNAGQRDEGVRRLELAVKLKPASAALHNNLGMFYKEEGRYAEAESELRETLRLKPGYPEAQVGLAYLCLQDGRRDEAISLLQQVVQSRPDLKVAEKMLRQATSARTP